MSEELIDLCWTDLFGTGPSSIEHLGLLKNAYSESGRHYHTLQHIRSLLKLRRENAEAFLHPRLADCAILYHDYVYDPSRKDNEERSAAVAARELACFGLTQEEIQVVCLFIRATQKHEVKEGPHAADLRLFLDLDLSVLAAPEAEYDAYAAAVRKEFAMYPDLLYKPGRKAVLKHFLEKPRIFLSARFFDLWETAARKNLEREIKTLRILF